MPRDFSDPWDPEDVFDRAAAAEYRRERAAKMEAAEAEARAEKAREAAQATEVATRRVAHGERMIRAEYEAKGLEPPEGSLVSLSLLLSMGWRISEESGVPKLVRPVIEKRRTRADYGT